MFKIHPMVAVLLALSLGLAACSKSDSSSSGSGSSSSGSSGSGGAAVTGDALDAQNFAMAEIQKHFVKSSHGWITARTGGSPYAPDHWVREISEITVTGVEPIDLSDSDKMNGTTWNGNVDFKKIPCREAGDQGAAFDGLTDPSANRSKGQWCQWVDYPPDPIHVWKNKGQWQVDEDTWILRGTMPTGQDFANAGVQP